MIGKRTSLQKQSKSSEKKIFPFFTARFISSWHIFNGCYIMGLDINDKVVKKSKNRMVSQKILN